MQKRLLYTGCVISILLLSFNGSAQLCTGSLGDPVVNISFGSGSNPGPALSSSITNYNYVSQPCPADGDYSIVNKMGSCYSDTWHVLAEDHTPGDVNGYMMLINASFNAGVFYLDTVRNLCGGTTYEFSAWIMSILKPFACNGNGNTPNLSFSIESTTGTVIQSYNTGTIPNLSSPQWTQYGFFFTLPAARGEVVLRLINNSAGGCGNDLVLDDIKFRPCGPKVNAAFVNVNGNGDTANYCISDNKTITINGSAQSGYNNPSFQWQQSTDSGASWHDIPGETGVAYTHTYNAAGVFQYRLTAAETGNIGVSRCRVSSNTLTIAIDAIPVPAAANTSPSCEQTAITLTAKNGNQYTWTGPNGFSSSLAAPVISKAGLQDAGKYYVLVQTKAGCSKQDSTQIIINPLPSANAGPDLTICETQTAALQASGGIRYAWVPAAGLSNATISNPVASPLHTTTYGVAVTSQANCTAVDSMIITVLKKSVANAGPDKKIEAGQTVQLNGAATGDTASYFWTPALYVNNTSLLAPVVSPPADITYTLHVMSGNGCGTATDEVFVRVFKKIAVPNAFSPNGDGINDTWLIAALDSYPESETRVFNRYGQVVFASKGYAKPWTGNFNGKPLPAGTYYYTIDRKNDFPLISGWIMVLR